MLPWNRAILLDEGGRGGDDMGGTFRPRGGGPARELAFFGGGGGGGGGGSQQLRSGAWLHYLVRVSHGGWERS